jgi:cardiolipin synthase A/B
MIPELPGLMPVTLFDALMLVWWVITLFMCVEILRQRRSPLSTIVWLLTVLLLPYIGVLLYLLIGMQKVRSEQKRVRGVKLPAEAVVPDGEIDALDRLLRRFGTPPATRGNRLHLHVTPARACAALIELIEGAQRTLWMQIYTIHPDGTSQRVLEALERAAARGVEVRVMADDVGSWGLGRRQVRDLEAAGVKYQRFRPVWYALSRRILNMRNHRKIVVADGIHAWTGGRNIGEQYLSELPRKRSWTDLSVTISGPAAAELEDICRGDWGYASGKDMSMPERDLCYDPEQSAKVQVIATGPDRRDALWHVTFIKCCFEAKDRLWIATPYFVPDEAALNAMTTAAASGVDVRILVPRKSDNALVDMVGRSYLRQVQRFGAKVFRHDNGMLHAKAILVDNAHALVGSANLDARSFFLNYEVMIASDDQTFVAELEQFFVQAAARSRPGIPGHSRRRETLTSIARILSPLL